MMNRYNEISPNPSVVLSFSVRLWTLAGWTCSTKLDTAACARSRLLDGNPTRKIDRPTRELRNLSQSRWSMSDHEVFVRVDRFRGVDHQPSVPAQAHEKPRQLFRSGPTGHGTVVIELAAM